jgi:hypothetical protein
MGDEGWAGGGQQPDGPLDRQTVVDCFVVATCRKSFEFGQSFLDFSFPQKNMTQKKKR